MIQGNGLRRYFRMAMRYGVLWFLYGRLPQHASTQRASWSRYFFVNENQPSSHREGPYTVHQIVSALKAERYAARGLGVKTV